MSDASVRFSCISDNSATTGEITTSQKKKKKNPSATNSQAAAKWLQNALAAKHISILRNRACVTTVSLLCYYRHHPRILESLFGMTSLYCIRGETGVKKNETHPSNMLWFWTSVTWTVWIRTESLEWFSERRCDPQKKEEEKCISNWLRRLRPGPLINRTHPSAGPLCTPLEILLHTSNIDELQPF